MHDLTPVIVTGIIFFFLSMSFKRLLDHFYRKRLAQNHFQILVKALEKVGAGSEAAELLTRKIEAPPGALPSEMARPTIQRISSALAAGLVITCLSVGFLSLPAQDSETVEAFRVLGGLGFSLGIGFLLASGATFFLSRRWGLLDRLKTDENPRL